MEKKDSFKKYKLLPYLFSIFFGFNLAPMFLEGWFDFEIFSIIFLMCFLVFYFTKIWIKQNNFVFVILIFILLICYPLKYAYIYYLISQDNLFVINALFDLQETNYLYISNEQHILFITYVISAFLGLFAVSFFTKKISFKNLKISLESFAKNKILNILLTKKISTYLYLFLTLLFSIIFAKLRIGIVNLIDASDYIVPFRLGLFFIIIQKYLLVIYGFSLVYFNKLRNKNKNLNLITKVTLYTYLIFTAIYTTSKQYVVFVFIASIFEIIFFKFKKSKSRKTELIIKSIAFIVSVFLTSVLLLFTIQARLVRNTTLCSDCGGIQTIFYLFDFLVQNGGFNALWDLTGDINTQNINFFNIVLFSTIFRAQGAACVIRIMSYYQNNPAFNFPDLFGFFESITNLRQAGNLFFAEVSQSFDTGFAFAPSFIGASLQLSDSIINPFIFTFSSCFLFLNLLFFLTKSKSPINILLACIISYEFLLGLSEGSFSYLMPLVGIISLLSGNLISNNRNVISAK